MDSSSVQLGLLANLSSNINKINLATENLIITKNIADNIEILAIKNELKSLGKKIDIIKILTDIQTSLPKNAESLAGILLHAFELADLPIKAALFNAATQRKLVHVNYLATVAAICQIINLNQNISISSSNNIVDLSIKFKSKFKANDLKKLIFKNVFIHEIIMLKSIFDLFDKLKYPYNLRQSGNLIKLNFSLPASEQGILF